jgi:galactonate dehydratase
MKITSVKTVVVNAQMRNWIFVKVATDEGLVGWGEASLEWKTRAVCGAVEDLAPLVVGQDPTRIEHLFQIMYRHPGDERAFGDRAGMLGYMGQGAG